MKRWHLILLVVFLVQEPSRACTAFCYCSGHQYFLAKNLDWPVDAGLILLNRPGIQKSSFEPSSEAIRWISRYGSITFNQFGKEFPLGGMNSEGLVVEELNMPAVPGKTCSSQKGLNEFQVVQYILDNFASVDEAEKGLDGFRLDPLLLTLHYLLMDREGGIRIVEYDGSSFVFHYPEKGRPAVLSNNTYAESISYLNHFRGFGGELQVQHRPGSNERFVSVAHMLSGSRTDPPVDHCFALLDTVSQHDTRWSLVYDAAKRIIHLKCHSCPHRQEIHLNELLMPPGDEVLGVEVCECNEDGSLDFRVIGREENGRLMESVLKQLRGELDLESRSSLFARMVSYGNRYLNEFTQELNRVIQALPDDSPLAYSDRLFDELGPWDSVEVVGMGEATHGTLEFVQLRQRLFRYLAENQHCRILAYEYSYRKSLLVDDYIHHRHGELDSLFTGDLWIQDNETLRHFIQWIREFNEGREEEDQVHFVGIDNQVDALQIPEVLEQIQGCLGDFEADLKLFPFNIPGKRQVDYQDMNRSEYDELGAAFSALEKQVEFHSRSLAHTSERSSHEVAFNLIRALRRSHEFLYLLYAEGRNIRDRQLAENVLRLVGGKAGTGPVALWAHNAHVAINPHYTPDGSPAMGWYLRDSLQKRYLSVATSFSLGQFTAVMMDSAGHDTAPLTCEIRQDPPAGSLNDLFHQALYAQFILNIRKLHPEGSLYRYLDKYRPMIGVGDLYLGSPELHFTDDRIINLARAHDLLFYFRDTGPLL
jgi:erythromycin esterase-like protein